MNVCTAVEIRRIPLAMLCTWTEIQNYVWSMQFPSELTTQIYFWHILSKDAKMHTSLVGGNKNGPGYNNLFLHAQVI